MIDALSREFAYDRMTGWVKPDIVSAISSFANMATIIVRQTGML